jgi:hypothetical protein
MPVSLIKESKTSIEEVVLSLTEQKLGTKWAEKTNQFAVNYVRHLGEVYGDVWYKGNLPKEFFFQILLPKHGHSGGERDDQAFFPLDTSIEDALVYYKDLDTNAKKECWECIQYLKEEIRQKGFTSNVVLVVINGKLKHVDGLHRMLALAILIKEGYPYPVLPVFLCDSTKQNEN